MKKQKIHINNKEITVALSVEGDDYISLTDIARFKDSDRTDYIIQNWMRNKDTVQFLGVWENIYNPNFNSIEFDGIKENAGYNGFSLTPKKWTMLVNSLGIKAKGGRYASTFAHKDIAFEFASWISPEFKLYLIKEFLRLKTEENERLTLGWNAKRMLTKINYKIHTDAIKENIIIPQELTNIEAGLVYASEADILNMALFGITAKDWREQNPEKEGNVRDFADVYQLVCLSNLESINAEFVRMGLTQQERLLKLNKTAIIQMKSLLKNNDVKKLE